MDATPFPSRMEFISLFSLFEFFSFPDVFPTIPRSRFFVKRRGKIRETRTLGISLSFMFRNCFEIRLICRMFMYDDN